MPRAPRWRWWRSNARSRGDDVPQRAGEGQGQPARGGAAGRRAGALPDGSGRHRLERDPRRVREPLARARSGGCAISAGRGRVLPRRGVWRGARAARARSRDRRGAGQVLAAQAHRGDFARGACARAPTSSSTARTCRRAWWCRNMPTLPPPLSGARRPAWSMPCSIIWRGACARGNMARDDDAMASHDETSAEDRLIARYFAPLATHPGALGLTDDAAFIAPPPGSEIVLKTDAIIGGVHFFAEDDAATVAQKALRVNLSDLAAKGAQAARLSAVAGAAAGDRRGVVVAFRRRPARGRRALRLPAVRRRYRPHAGADHHFRRHVRQRAGGDHGAPRRRQAGRPRLRQRHYRRCRARPGAAQGRHLEARRGAAPASRRRAICCRSRAMRWPRPCAATPPPPWTFPTGLPAISPSSAACRRWRRTSRSCACRSPRRPGP